MLRRLGLAAALATGATGCAASIGLTQDPMFNGPTRSPRIQLFSVEWWRPLVKAELLEYQPREIASPAVDPDTHRVVVLTRDGFVRSIDPEGKTEWEFKTYGGFNAAAAFHDGMVYVPAGDGNLYALRARTGELVWKYAPGEELATTPVFAAGKVLVASEANTVFAVEQKTGKWLWQYRRDLPASFTIRGAAAPAVANGVAYVGFADGAVVALKIDDGAVKWERTLSEGTQFIDVDTTPVLDEAGHLFVASYKDGLFSLDAASGNTVWRTPTAGVTSLVLQGQILFAGGDEKLSAVLAGTGRTLWTLALPGRATRPPVLVHGMLVVPTSHALLFVDPRDGIARVSWNPGKGITATPFGIDSRLYVLSNLGYLYALRLHGRSG
jgi:outer membrane protein assembly factor BamB